MIVACVTNVAFRLDAKNHTVQYASAAQRMEFDTPKVSKLEHVVAPDFDAAKLMLGAVVREYLKQCPTVTLKSSDFAFGFSYEPVRENGTFFGHGGYCNCGSTVYEF